MVCAFTIICAAFAVTAAIDENNVNEKRCKGWTAGWEHAFDRQSIKPTSLDGDGGACSTQWSHEIHSASCMSDHTVVLGKGFATNSKDNIVERVTYSQLRRLDADLRGAGSKVVSCRHEKTTWAQYQNDRDLHSSVGGVFRAPDGYVSPAFSPAQTLFAPASGERGHVGRYLSEAGLLGARANGAAFHERFGEFVKGLTPSLMPRCFDSGLLYAGVAAATADIRTYADWLAANYGDDESKYLESINAGYDGVRHLLFEAAKTYAPNSDLARSRCVQDGALSDLHDDFRRYQADYLRRTFARMVNDAGDGIFVVNTHGAAMQRALGYKLEEGHCSVLAKLDGSTYDASAYPDTYAVCGNAYEADPSTNTVRVPGAPDGETWSEFWVPYVISTDTFSDMKAASVAAPRTFGGIMAHDGDDDGQVSRAELEAGKGAVADEAWAFLETLQRDLARDPETGGNICMLDDATRAAWATVDAAGLDPIVAVRLDVGSKDAISRRTIRSPVIDVIGSIGKDTPHYSLLVADAVAEMDADAVAVLEACYATATVEGPLLEWKLAADGQSDYYVDTRGGSLLPFPNKAWTPDTLDRKLVNPYVKVLSCLPELALELGAPAPRSCRDVHAVYHEAGCCGDAEASTDVIF